MSQATMFLRGGDGTVIPLAQPGTNWLEGISLVDVPDGLSGFSVDNDFESIYQGVGGLYRGRTLPVAQMRVDLQARGDDPRAHVNEVLDLLEARPVQFVVNTPDLGERYVDCRFSGVSNVKWHGLATSSPFAKFSILLDVGRPLWQCGTQSIELTPGKTTWGDVELATPGDQPFWPRFTITGEYSELQIRLSEHDDWQLLPHQAAGWVIESNPAKRSVKAPNGTPFTGLVPFWPTPTQVVQNEAVIQILPVSAQADFKILVEWEAEARRAW